MIIKNFYHFVGICWPRQGRSVRKLMGTDLTMYLGDWLQRRTQLSPDKIALIDAERGMRSITYREWNAAAGRSANFLRGLGVGRGDRVAILAQNCVEFLDLWFACGKIGAIMQPLNWRFTVSELAALIADATPSVLFYGPDYVETARILAGQPGSVRRWIALDSAARLNPGDLTIDERDSYPAEVPPIELSREDPWVICYTGGTTGTPKGAVLTHGNIGANATNTVLSWGLRPDDVTILNSPLFHTGGLNVFTAPLVQIGGTSIVCRGFNVDQVYDLLQNAGVTVYFGVPTMYITLQQHPRWAEADFSKLRLLLSGGAPCPLPVFEAFWDRGIDFKTGYGLTEAGPNTFWLPPADVRRKPKAVGFPLFYIDVKLVKADGSECGPNEVGELYIRGPHVCKGYWNRPEETAKTIVNGWLRTGDLAQRDAEGYYSIVGRLKDVIISGGENVYPAEVESVLAGHPSIAEVALIAAPDPRWGEVGWAVAVPLSGSELSETDLLTFAAKRLARYKLPKRVIIAASLPKTGAGKIDKQTLVKTYVTTP